MKTVEEKPAGGDVAMKAVEGARLGAGEKGAEEGAEGDEAMG